MGEKSVQKRQYIIDTAKKVFMEKGYQRVTMKDIVEACNISRGGLYLYFDSTKDIFLELLRQEIEFQDVFAEGLDEDISATDMLAIFLKEQKKEILRKKNSLSTAVYEFYFENKLPKKDNIPRQQFDNAVKILEELIQMGMEYGEFYEVNAAGAARNIMFVLEGLKISAKTIGITETIVDAEILYIMEGLIIDTEE